MDTGLERTVVLQVPITFRDLQRDDVDPQRLGWSGGEVHLAAIGEALDLAWAGEVDVLVGELPTGQLVACGAVDHRKLPSELWMLSVDARWQSLGLGTALIGALEHRIVERGRDHAGLGVEWDNPRARALYSRLGYVDSGLVLDGWPQDDGTRYVTWCTQMTKSVGATQDVGGTGSLSPDEDERADPPRGRPGAPGQR
ncbi:GNAT family N-acetyltransferase [Aestuariimicrobium sp. T2.26MG-19.2B]|uniref:GNAT family N-acetyltransferase n=1 Tax=Aestuariimicrobium sp. T2.26MG-19.2B TaxID=3040679 RepID=UPI00247795A9|nr:N-acetyltransferase [Aestuariimicrobium sp. T2.26MG-19.2B]CAI9405384.1 Mycothiol acetyltransferase [Aestuariimicrobium sp. T2.26MG-19.2B]